MVYSTSVSVWGIWSDISIQIELKVNKLIYNRATTLTRSVKRESYFRPIQPVLRAGNVALYIITAEVY